MKLRLTFLLILLALTALACQAAESVLDAADILPTQDPLSQDDLPDLGIGDAPPARDVLFQDDFSDPNSGWDRLSTENGLTDYQDGIYRIYVNATNTDVWANPGLNFTDTVIQVDATKVAGDDDNDFGLICRYTDSDNFYFFVISSDGYYGVGKIIAGDQQLVGMESMPPSEIINQGQATNRLRAECVGSTLRLYVNGELLAETQDTDFSSGDVGLLAGSFTVPGTDIYFDNLVVSKP